MATATKKRPNAGSVTRRVWEIADDLSRAAGGALPSGREVADAYLAEDPSRNEGTAFTQYSHWKKTHLQSVGTDEARLPDGGVVVTVSPDGQLVVPASLREALGWRAGETLILRERGDHLQIQSRAAAIRAAQTIVAAADKGRGAASAELIAERRLDAQKEQ
ncbi:MAG: AbrB/MazE/SpoVT family DNA-binding domain-containing protein [Pseudomonadota bacterium]